MRTILQKEDREQIAERINRLQESDQPLWGRMTANEMLCHVSDIFRMAFGEIAAPDQTTFFTTQVVARLVLLGLPIPKGKIETSPALNQSQGQGTRPTDFTKDKALFHEKMTEFLAKDTGYRFEKHGTFGHLTKQEWARLIFLHTAHHLKQFGK